MEQEIKQIMQDYFKLNQLKYRYNESYNNYNHSKTIASKIFGSSMIATTLCSEVFPKSDMSSVIKNILLSEIDKNLHIRLGKYDQNDMIAKMAINLEENYPYFQTKENIYDFYLATNKLKTTTRTGWIYWQVLASELEKVSEHVYGTCVLAILMSRLNKDIDIDKVIKMLILHETEEILIGDITVFDKTTSKEKETLGHLAIKKIFSKLNSANELNDLILEFDECKTKEAKFAYMCDKLEADLQVIAYENMGYNHMDHQESNPAYNSTKVQKIIEDGASSVAEVWYEFDKDKFDNNDTFAKVLKYAVTNNK